LNLSVYSFKNVSVPDGYWDNIQHQKEFFDNIAAKLGISSPEQWYQVRLDDIATFGGAGLLATRYSSSLPKALETVYPEHKATFAQFRRHDSHGLNQKDLHLPASKRQYWLWKMVQKIWPQHPAVMDYRDKEIVLSATQKHFSIDVYLLTFLLKKK
jgi:hypothetical protein